MDKKIKILLIEDDGTISFGIKTFLEKNNYFIHIEDSIKKAKDIFTSTKFDLIILDLNLPDGNGFDFCSYIKSVSNVPIIFLTVHDDEKNIVKGLDMGADDYITKPFQFTVLLSRIKAVLRRSENLTGGTSLKCGNVSIDKLKTQAYISNHPITLTSGEYKLLLIFLENKNQTLTRNTLLEKLWDIEGDFINDNTLTVTIKRLRGKLLKEKYIIKTIRGIGYRAEELND